MMGSSKAGPRAGDHIRAAETLRDAHRVLVNDRIMAAHEAARLAAAAEGGAPAQIPVAPGKGA